MNERGDNDGQPTYHVGTPPQAAYYTPPPRKQRRTTPLWATVTTGAVALIAGVGIGSGGSKDTPAAGASPATVYVTVTAPAGGASSAAPTPVVTKVAAPADKGAMGDVVLGKFTVDSFGVTVPVTVINHSSKRSNYIIQFEVDDSTGTKIGDGIASTNNLTPGQKALISGESLGTGDGTPAAVKLTDVTRYPS